MLLSRQAPAFVLALGLSVSVTAKNLTDEINAQWRKPAKFWDTDLDATINAKGTYNFIFNSSTLPKGIKYGSYDYCNMPHVRKPEYRIPSKEYKLEYVEIIHRHHKRTPYASNLWPEEKPPYDCSNTELFTYGEGKGVPSVPLYWTPLWTSENPFTTVGEGSNCQFPQLTQGGFQDSWQHGNDLFGVYHDLLHFLPNQPNGKQMKFRVTNNVITSQVASALIAGMYPALARKDIPLSVFIENSAIDSLEPTYSCNAANTLSSAYGVGSTDPAWTPHLNASQDLREALNKISGVDPTDSGWSQSWDHYFDNLSSRQCHGIPLPCNGTCVTQDQVNEVYRLGMYEYAYLYRVAPESLLYGVEEYGVWIAEFLGNVRAATSGTSTVKYTHNVAHDGSMSRLLAALQTEVMFWPGMGCELSFEIYSKQGFGYEKKEWYARILFGGQVFKSSTPEIGVADMIPLDKLTGYLNGLVGNKAANVVTLCNSS
ncbi:histidine acid phosphatase-like protein [Rhizodiscina lignyota]|uniref:Histidine acid phosphatase-like protein n=1 Tax=Rhizodiscina lignyota TaxID=1504668 RepID=A0A9P4IMH5_9PEZI|nr:histidine acid phosphatase-like protein [Rhizodiscina lignyota]